MWDRILIKHLDGYEQIGANYVTSTFTSCHGMAWLTSRTPTGGGSDICPPWVFFSDSVKTAARSSAKFGMTIPTFIAHITRPNIWTPYMLRSGHRVTLSDLTSRHTFWSLAPRCGNTNACMALKLIWSDQVMVIYNSYISDFWNSWPKVRSFVRPAHYKSMGEIASPTNCQQIRSTLAALWLFVS